MKILIIGRGYIGVHLERCMSKTHDVLCVNRELVDYHNISLLDGLLKTQKPDVVFSAFGFTGRPNIDQAELMKSECWNLNVSIPLQMNKACAERKIGFVHISSGCIFDGYTKQWEDCDEPNFGMFHNSSFYSKTKHAFELVSKDLPGTVIRIRMPFSGCTSGRNYLMKLIGYNNIIDMVNSRTCVSDLSTIVLKMAQDGYFSSEQKRKIIHLANPNPISSGKIVEMLRLSGISNNTWKIVDLHAVHTTAPRSNCIIANSRNPYIEQIPEETYSMKKCIASLAKAMKKHEIASGGNGRVQLST